MTRDLPTDHTLIRCSSHRAREKAHRIAGEGLQSFYSWETACTGGFIAVPDQLVGSVLTVKGCGKASQRFSYLPCLNWT